MISRQNFISRTTIFFLSVYVTVFILYIQFNLFSSNHANFEDNRKKIINPYIASSLILQPSSQESNAFIQLVNE